MTADELQEQLAKTEAMVRSLQEELAETNRGLVAMTLELERRADERNTQLQAANTALARSNARLASTEGTVHALQEELAETNRGLVAMTLELEQRVDARTAELRQLTLELEERVRERTAQLREANENLNHFAYTAAHDLRAPLRAIKSFSSMAVEEYGARLESEGQSLLQRVTESAGRMQQLLDDLLEYSKLGQAELKLEPVNLQHAVRDALALLEADIRTKNAAIAVEDSLPIVVGHPATMVMLINNFVSNALKFIPPGVQPQIRIWAQQQPMSGIMDEWIDAPAGSSHPSTNTPLHASTPFVRLWVEDNGIGIEKKDLARVFEVFQRIHGKGAYPGTGLGLAIVRKGAERMGGRVGVESEVGKGSRFWVELKAARAAS